ncbi:hypothetical protein X801_04976 [Opisthorchis viverrini]|uniref:Uncharacterized protein n=1 Tax=Opisthorchis viverrini TaxID=6198 RepID=A0A1S8WXB1_OPIVI|nr:hypothetical protein X801_04976 [Opisthorchis viverrini]
MRSRRPVVTQQHNESESLKQLMDNCGYLSAMRCSETRRLRFLGFSLTELRELFTRHNEEQPFNSTTQCNTIRKHRPWVHIHSCSFCVIRNFAKRVTNISAALLRNKAGQREASTHACDKSVIRMQGCTVAFRRTNFSRQAKNNDITVEVVEIGGGWIKFSNDHLVRLDGHLKCTFTISNAWLVTCRHVLKTCRVKRWNPSSKMSTSRWLILGLVPEPTCGQVSSSTAERSVFPLDKGSKLVVGHRDAFNYLEVLLRLGSDSFRAETDKRADDLARTVGMQQMPLSKFSGTELRTPYNNKSRAIAAKAFH